MLARDLAEPYPSVSTDISAVDAARLLTEHELPALLVLDTAQRPYAIVQGSQLIKQLVPEYVLEDPRRAAAIDDRHLAEVTEKIAGLAVTAWLPPRTYTPPVVGPDAGALQVTALMARTHTPLVAVIERDGNQVRLVGAITAARLLERLIGGS
ncbi:CBS domain-containing protein [Streptomyces sp. NBC_01481]|uniref:CBS domain-containing protein n=1 Tax=Streptomyces sp. NBC_01481 TaxID=2975869 RepID=UPI0022588C7A|nr:CBS domain-containing protein [Streptomyces sp. NBC_01481]MCX4581521.1 CBS domain-containing protein [Streptomyces sp. NBC_01481]